MKKIKQMKNNAGISIVQVILAAGMMGGLAIGLMQLTKQQMAGTSRVEAGYEVAATLQKIRAILSDPVNCKESFLGEVVHSFNSRATASADRIVKKDRSGNFNDNFIVGERYGQGNIKINSYGLTFTETPPVTDEAFLIIQFDRGRAVGKGSIINKKIPLEITADASNKIQTCAATSSGVGGIWQRMPPPNENKIFYNEGYVAIGSTSPKALLHLEAEKMQPALYIFTENDQAIAASPNGIHLKNRASNTPQDYNLSVSHDNNFRIQRGGHSGTVDFSVAPDGNVGIGITDAKAQLQVKGSIMVGYDDICDSNTKGKLRYNSTFDKMEYCSSSGWRSAGGASLICATLVKIHNSHFKRLVSNHTTETEDNIFEIGSFNIRCKNDFFMVACSIGGARSGSRRTNTSPSINPYVTTHQPETCLYDSTGVGGSPIYAMFVTCCRNE